MPTLLVHLAEQDAEFRGAGCVQRIDARAGPVAQQLPPDSREGEPDRVLVEAAEPLDNPLVVLGGESPERGVLTVDPIQPGSIEPREKGVPGVLDIELAIR